MSNYNFKSARKLAAFLATAAVVGVFAGPEVVNAQTQTAEASPATEQSSEKSIQALAAGENVKSVTEETYAKNQEIADNFDLEALTANDGFGYNQNGDIVSVTIGGETAEVSQSKPEVVEAPKTQKPNRISTNLASNPQTEMNVQWHTSEADPDARLYVSTSEDMSNAVEYQPEILKIDDAFYAQQTVDGDYVYAIMWDKEKNEPFTNDKKDPFIAVKNPQEVVGYFTDGAFTSNNLQWLDKGFDDWSLILPYPPMTEYAYKVTATNLDPDTLYYYQVGNPKVENGLSAVGRFGTASDKDQNFRFVHYTDTQNAASSENQRSESAYSRSTAEAILVKAGTADFVTHTGDLVNDQWNDTEWNHTMSAISPLVKAMPHLMVTGNHDSEEHLIHLNTPHELKDIKNGAVYSLDYNGAHFVVLNTEDKKADGSMISPQQMEWLKADLEDAYNRREAGELNWIIVTYHRPLFSSSYHSLEDESVQVARKELMSTLDHYDVDLVLNGHDHNLTVTYPLLYNDKLFGAAERDDSDMTVEGDTTTFHNPEGTVFAVISTAGTKTYDAIYKNQSFDWIIENEDIHTTYKELFNYDVTPSDIDYFQSLMIRSEQPFVSPFYADGHSNAREANIQHFAVVDVTPEAISYEIFEVVGEDLNNRDINSVHTYVITKDQKPAKDGRVVAKIANEEAHQAEQAAAIDNQSPAGVKIGVKEWQPSDKEGNINTDPRNHAGQFGKAAEYRQYGNGAYEVKVGDQWIAASTEKPAVATIYESKNPDRITNQVGSDAAREMNLAWFTRTNKPVEGSTVQVSLSKDFDKAAEGVSVDLRTYNTYSDYFERTEDGYFIQGYSTDDDWSDIELWITDEHISADNAKYTSGNRGYLPIQMIEETIYHADVRGLDPNTTYYFRVGSEGNWSDVGSFTTASDVSAPFAFIHYTDTQNAYWNENVRNEPQYAADTMKQAMKLFPQADFALHTGDFVETAQAEDEWVDIIGQTQDVFLNLPHAMVSGNHDAYSTYTWNNGQLNAFNNHVNAPDAEGRMYGGSYYSFDYNNTHFVILNTNDSADENGRANEIVSDAQMEWIKNDLQSEAAKNADWVVVSFHKPLFSGSYHSLQDSDVQKNRAELIKLFTDNEVDVVISGHDHVNSVSKPLLYTDDAPIGNAKLAADSHVSREDDMSVYTDPKGTVFVTLNTAGTKLYKDIYNQGIDYIAKVRPKVAQALGAKVENGVIVEGREEAEANLAYWNDLFTYQNQPGESPKFEVSHSNNREGSTQNFATYEVTPDSFKMTLWEIKGDLAEGERSEPFAVNSFVIRKNEEGGGSTQPSDKPTDQKDEQTKLPQEIIDLQNKVSALEKLAEALTAQEAKRAEEIEKLKAEIARLNVEVKDAQANVAALENKVKDLSQKLADCCPSQVKDKVKGTVASKDKEKLDAVVQDLLDQQAKDKAKKADPAKEVAKAEEAKAEKAKDGEQAKAEEEDSEALPQTGIVSTLGLAAASIIAGLGLAADRKRQ